MASIMTRSASAASLVPTCPGCGLVFKTKNTLRAHVRSHETVELPPEESESELMVADEEDEEDEDEDYYFQSEASDSEVETLNAGFHEQYGEELSWALGPAGVRAAEMCDLSRSAERAKLKAELSHLRRQEHERADEALRRRHDQRPKLCASTALSLGCSLGAGGPELLRSSDAQIISQHQAHVGECLETQSSFERDPSLIASQ